MTKLKSESGQAILIVAVAFVVLVGIAGLAIDGGMLYSDRRNAQNIADAAAMAGAGQAATTLKSASGNWSTLCNNARAGAEAAAIVRAGSNQVTLTSQTTGQLAQKHNGVNATCNQNPNSIDITVEISQTTQALMSQFVFGGKLRSQVQAVARVLPSEPVLPGNGIIAMEANCNKNYNNVSISGGGNSGTVDVWGGGIFINTIGSASCGLAPGSSNSAGTIIAHGGTITNVGSFDYAFNNRISPNPIQTGYNNGSAISDPLANLSEPVCSSAGTKSVDGHYNPGRYGGPGELSLSGGELNEGIYCISGTLKLSGSDKLVGTHVLLYFANGGLTFSGQSGMTISAPNSGPYAGIAIFAARSNTNTLDVRGNGGQAVVGMIYTLNGVVSAKGGGSTPGEADVTGQVIANQIENPGNGSLSVTYNSDSTYHSPANMSLYR